MVAIFPVPGETATAVEPSDAALDDPTLRFDDKALDAVAASDDLDLQCWHDAGDGVPEDRPGVGAVREHLAKEWALSEHSGQQQHAAVAILNIGGSDQRVQQQTELVDQHVTLLALDQLAGVEAMRIAAG